MKTAARKKYFKNYLNKEFFFSLLIISVFFIIMISISFIFSFNFQRKASIEKAKLVSDNIAESMSSKFNLVNKIFLDSYFVDDFFTLQDNLISNDDSRFQMSNYFATFVDPTVSSVVGAGYIPRIDNELKSNQTVIYGSIDIRITLVSESSKQFLNSLMEKSYEDENKKGKCFIINYDLDDTNGYLVFCRNISDLRKDTFNEKLGIGFILVNRSTFFSPLTLANSIDNFHVYITNRVDAFFSSDKDNYYNESRNGLFYYKQALNYDDLYLESFYNYRDFFSSDNNGILNQLVIYFAIVLLFAFLYFYWYKKSTGALNYLFVNFNEQKNKMEMDPIEFLKSDNEVNVVIEAYNSLVTSVKELNDYINEQRNNNALLEIQNKNFEIENLHLQINRHFIINVLTIVHSLINLNDIEKAKYCLECLGDYLRYSLSFKVKETELGNEIKFVKNYVNLQLVRYENVYVSYNIDDKALGIIVPKMIIQPLFENAFVHGLKSKTGIITLDVYFEQDNLIILVGNNCSTIDDAAIEKVNKTISEANVDNGVNMDTSHGIALKNIQKRLNLFSKNTSVYLEKKEDITYSVITMKVGD